MSMRTKMPGSSPRLDDAAELPAAVRGSSFRPSAVSLTEMLRVEPLRRDLRRARARSRATVCSVSSRRVTSSPSTSSVAMQPSALRLRTSASASSRVSPGDVPRGDPPHDRLRHERQRLDDQAVERLHGSPASRPRSVRDARAKHQTVTERRPLRRAPVAGAFARGRAGGGDVVDEQDAPGRASAERGRRPARWPRAAPAGTRLWISVSRVLTSRSGAKGSRAAARGPAARTSAGW